VWVQHDCLTCVIYTPVTYYLCPRAEDHLRDTPHRIAGKATASPGLSMVWFHRGGVALSLASEPHHGNCGVYAISDGISGGPRAGDTEEGVAPTSPSRGVPARSRLAAVGADTGVPGCGCPVCRITRTPWLPSQEAVGGRVAPPGSRPAPASRAPSCCVQTPPRSGGVPPSLQRRRAVPQGAQGDSPSAARAGLWLISSASKRS
jgi:hypothetical protein